ncbi:hypothetical protein TNCV_1326041 [Trichonephila clavipes]|nr:hypothetical protein TNCV_1326041 [Trichonephila clavipes]
MDCQTRSNKSGVLAMSAEATTICAVRSSSVVTGVSCTSNFRWSPKEEIQWNEVREVCLTIGLQRPIHLPGHVAWRWFALQSKNVLMYHLRVNHTFSYAVATTLCSNSGRSGKFVYVQVSLTIPRRSKSPLSFGHTPLLARRLPGGYYFFYFHRLNVVCDPCSMLICHPHAAYYHFSQFVCRIRQHFVHNSDPGKNKKNKHLTGVIN